MFEFEFEYNVLIVVDAVVIVVEVVVVMGLFGGGVRLPMEPIANGLPMDCRLPMEFDC